MVYSRLSVLQNNWFKEGNDLYQDQVIGVTEITMYTIG